MGTRRVWPCLACLHIWMRIQAHLGAHVLDVREYVCAQMCLCPHPDVHVDMWI